VISDFSDLNAVGKQHYLNTHGGSAPVSVIDALDGAEEARELILETPGTVTPFGVVYDNGMVLERYYAGREFPAYLYDVPLLTVDVSKKSAPDEPATCLCLPMPEVCLKRALARGGFDDPADMNLEMRVLAVPSDIFRWIAPNTETPEGLNAAAGAIAGLSESDRHTFCAVAEYLEPESSADLRALAERIGQFEFYEGVSTAEEYGRRLITEMGCFMRDIDMDEFFDFEGFGKRRLENEQGGFMGEGYIRYDGDIPLEKLLTQTRQHHGQGMTMGGI
jgi:hypothetical protein